MTRNTELPDGGARIQMVRRLLRLSQADVAQRMACNRSYICQLEHGKKGVTPKQFILIVTKMGLSRTKAIHMLELKDANAIAKIDSSALNSSYYDLLAARYGIHLSRPYIATYATDANKESCSFVMSAFFTTPHHRETYTIIIQCHPDDDARDGVWLQRHTIKSSALKPRHLNDQKYLEKNIKKFSRCQWMNWIHGQDFQPRHIFKTPSEHWHFIKAVLNRMESMRLEIHPLCKSGHQAFIAYDFVLRSIPKMPGLCYWRGDQPPPGFRWIRQNQVLDYPSSILPYFPYCADDPESMHIQEAYNKVRYEKRIKLGEKTLAEFTEGDAKMEKPEDTNERKD